MEEWIAWGSWTCCFCLTETCYGSSSSSQGERVRGTDADLEQELGERIESSCQSRLGTRAESFKELSRAPGIPGNCGAEFGADSWPSTETCNFWGTSGGGCTFLLYPCFVHMTDFSMGPEFHPASLPAHQYKAFPKQQGLLASCKCQLVLLQELHLRYWCQGKKTV